MSDNLSTKYNPQEVEAGRYQEWLAKDLFKPSGDQKSQALFNRYSSAKCYW